MMELNTIILAVVVAGFVIAIAWKATIGLQQPTNIKTCRLSVEAGSAIRGSPIAVNRACETFIDREIGSAKKDQALQRISDRLWECWYMNGEGKYHAFESREGTEAHCFICSQFTLSESITENELLRFITKDQYQHEADTVRKFLNQGLLRWKGQELLAAEHVRLPKDEDRVQRMLSSIATDLDPNIPMALKPFAVWNIWFSAAEIAPLETLHKDTYAVLFYQVTPQYWRQTWEARAATAPFDSETLQAVTRIPPAKVFITKLSTVADSSCEVLQG